MTYHAYQHSCGGWYVARENDDGYHHAPSICRRGRCDMTRAAAEREIAKLAPEFRSRVAIIDRELDRTYCADDVPQGMREIVIEVAR